MAKLQTRLRLGRRCIKRWYAPAAGAWNAYIKRVNEACSGTFHYKAMSQTTLTFKSSRMNQGHVQGNFATCVGLA